MASFFRTNIDNFVSTLRVIDHYCRGNNQSQPSSQSTNPRRPARQTGHRQPSTYNNHTPNGACDELHRCQNPHHNHSSNHQPQPQQQQTWNHQRANSQQPQSNMSTNPNRNPPLIRSNDKLDIGDILDPSDISRLSAKELKTVLTRNCIDFKGCIEKEELREKVMRLWIDYNERMATRRHNRARQNQDSNRSQDSSDDIDENQLCKICMEREIDCVLLECGHYLTCVTCGRKLAECPICRQNITRCVRTFKG